MTRNADFRPILRPIALATLTLVLTACGGGGDSSAPAPSDPSDPALVAPSSISGTAVDGYIAGATINCMKGDQLVASTTSGADGKFAFALAAGQSCDVIESIGGVDVGITPNDTSDDVLRPAGVLRSMVPMGTSGTLTSFVVSPLTTLVEALVIEGSTPEAAAELVRTSLGLPAGLDLATADPTSDAALYKAASVVAQVIDQITAALSAAGGVTDAAGQQDLADAAITALATNLSGISLTDLAAAPDALTAASPLVAIVQDAVTNAQAEGSLAGVQPATLALVAAPLVASATSSVASASSIQDIVDQANTIDDQDRTAGVVTAVVPLLDNTATDAQALLDQVANAVVAADTNAADAPVTITIGAESAPAVVPAGLSNYALFANDQVGLYTSGGSSTVALADFAGSGVSVPQALARIGFNLAQSGVGTQLDAPFEAPLAVQVKDATRTFQALFDRVVLSKDGSSNVLASLPTGAKVSVYGKTATTETTSPLVMTLAGGGLTIVRTTGGSGEIAIDFDQLFTAIGSAAAPGSALATLAANRVSSGTYDVTVAIGTLRLARVTSSTDATPVLTGAYTVTLGAGTGSVTGHGLQGKVTVGP